MTAGKQGSVQDLLPLEDIVDDWGLGTQIVAVVSGRTTPVVEASWGEVKNLYR